MGPSEAQGFPVVCRSYPLMRILVISDVTGFMRGGVPVETAQLVRGLQARNHQLAFMGDIPIEGAELVQHFVQPKWTSLVTTFACLLWANSWHSSCQTSAKCRCWKSNWMGEVVYSRSRAAQSKICSALNAGGVTIELTLDFRNLVFNSHSPR